MEAEHEWEAACKRSEAYKSRVSGTATSRLGLGESAREQNKKRRISTAAEVQEKRAKRRRSKQFEKPLTDEALARRLQEVRALLSDFSEDGLELIVRTSSPRTARRTRSGGRRGRSARPCLTA